MNFCQLRKEHSGLCDWRNLQKGALRSQPKRKHFLLNVPYPVIYRTPHKPFPGRNRLLSVNSSSAKPSIVSAAPISSTYQQGIDDFYQNQAESQKKKLDTIHEDLLYIMFPFVYEEDMDEFCTDLLRFAMDHNYRPENEWKRYKTKLSSFDVRHLVCSIAIRLGLGKGKVYSNDDCACYIERRFASLCVTASGEPLSHSTLRNLTVTSNSDQIHCDIQGENGLLFHIPSQLGI